jgi:hypothetical protein
MAAAADFEVAYVISSFDELFAGLQNGKYDAAIGAITVTDERNTIVDFTDPYFTAGQAAVSFYNPGQGIAIRTDTPAITGWKAWSAVCVSVSKVARPAFNLPAPPWPLKSSPSPNQNPP